MNNDPTSISIRLRLPEDESSDTSVAKEEVIILWDRIVAVALLLALLVGLLLMAVQYWRSLEKMEQQGAGLDALGSVRESSAASQAQTYVPPVAVAETATKIAVEVPGPLPATVAEIASSSPLAEAEPEDVVSLAPVTVHSQSLRQARLTTELVDRNPLSDAPMQLVVPSDRLLTVYFFVEIDGFRAKPIFFNWYRNDALVARVRIRPRRDSTETFSSKYIDQNMTGQWRVELVSQEGDAMAESTFTVIPDQMLADFSEN